MNTEPDGFPYFPDSPYAQEHARLDDYLRDVRGSDLLAQSGKLEKPVQLALVCATMERIEFQKGRGKANPLLTELIKKLAGRKLPYEPNHLVWNLSCAANILAPKDPRHVQFDELNSPIPGVVPPMLDELEKLQREKPLSPELLNELKRLHAALKPMEFWAGYKKTVQRIESLQKQKCGMPDSGEAWADAIRNDVKAMPAKARAHWLNLLENAPKGTSAKPTAKWRKQANVLLEAVGKKEFTRQIEHWFALVGQKESDRIQPRNAALLRSLVWYASLLSGETVCRALANAVEGGLRRVNIGGLYASSISKACIAALEVMPGLEGFAQLSRLKQRVKSPWGKQEIEKAFASAAARSELPRAEIEEVCLPTFGLDKNGSLRQKIGEFTAELKIASAREVAITWLDARGHALPKKPDLPKSVATEEKALKQLAADIQKMAAAQRDRIGNFLELDRAWTFETWKTRYLDHPLLAGISRRLIWQFEQGKRTASGIWHQKGFVAADGKDLETPNAAAKVRLWHPLGVDPDRVQAWRRWLMEHEVTQPFKQAFREIYILTDAERKTHNYSNRFAGHILRQHQFKALCQQRGWSYEFIGEWDQSDPVATKDLSSLKLRAEFWIEPTQSGAADSGVSLLVATDRVRFRTPDRQVVPLTDVPALVFSEIMRDVDLFVSVGTVGNDPQWADTGDERGRDYWRKWAFGELTVTAAMRREILERLLPKLRIASRCSLAGRFLNVRGSLTTYKIHLGSGHVLMEPNDKYLCIGPDWSRARSKAGDKVFLPFEGDSIFSIILSEAFLLAEDSRIKDETILNQIAAD